MTEMRRRARVLAAVCASMVLALASPAVGRTSDDRPTQAAETAEAGSPALPLSASDRARLRARLEERWRVAIVRDGLVLVPRRAGGSLRGVEITGDSVAIDGRPVTGAELRQRLGADAEAVLALTYLDPAARRTLFEVTAAAGPTAGRGDRATTVSPPPAEGPDLRRATHRHGARVRIGSDLVVGEHERIGDAAVAIFGSVVVDGEVAGDVVAVAGDVRLGPKAVVEGDVTAVGGRIVADPGARMYGGVNEVAIRWPTWSVGVLEARVLPPAEWWAGLLLVAAVARALVLAVLTMIVALLARAAVTRVGREVGDAPWQSILVGVGAQLVFVPAAIALCGGLIVSIVGIPLLALVPVAALVAAGFWLVGFTAVAARLGGALIGGSESGRLAPAVLLGLGLVFAVTLAARLAWWAGWIGLPGFLLLGGVGWLVEAVAWSMGLGALILSWFRGKTAPTAEAVPSPVPALQ